MKRTSYLMMCLLFAATHAIAQTPDKAVGMAHYTFTQVKDTNNRAKPYTENFILLLGKNASVYRSLDKQLNEEKMVAEVNNQVKNASNPHAVDLTLHSAPPTTSDEYFQYIKGGKLYTERKILNYYLTEEPLPQIKWKIARDTMSFGGIRCQKATTHFRGRDYEAWFCPDLPFSNGPWKLCGLPGLIVEAYDSKREVVFKFDGYEDKSQAADMIAIPENDIRATAQDVDRLYQARLNDPKGFAKSAHGDSNSQRGRSAMDMISAADIKSINIVGSGSKQVINNPIELPEEKK